MPVSRFGTTQTFAGAVAIDAYGTGTYAAYENGGGTLSIVANGARSTLATGIGYYYALDVLSDGGFVVSGLANYGQGAGAAIRVINRDGTFRTAGFNAADTASGTESISSPLVTATLNGGFVVTATDTTHFGEAVHISYPYRPDNVAPYGFDGNRAVDVGYRVFDAAAAGGAWMTANVGSYSDNGATTQYTFNDQFNGASETLANGTVVTVYASSDVTGIPTAQGGGYMNYDAVDMRLVTASGLSTNIRVDSGSAGSRYDKAGGQEIVSLGSAGFAVIWQETHLAADGSRDGTDTKIRYFDVNGAALTGELQLLYRPAALGNFPANLAADALGDGSIAFVYENGQYGVNGTAAGQLFVGTVGPLGQGVEVSAITAAPVQGTYYENWDLVSLGEGRVAVSFTGIGSNAAVQGAAVQTFNIVREIQGTAGPETLTGGAFAEAIYGLGANDILIGNGGDDQLFGGIGNDSLFGGSGSDLLQGDDGDDQLTGGAGADSLNGGAGFDFARYDDAAAAVTAVLFLPSVNTGDAAGDSYAGIEGLVGSSFADNLQGDDAVNEIFGLGGSDAIFGRTGNDTLRGGDGLDNLWGGAGADALFGDGGFDFARYDFAPGPVTAVLFLPSANTGEAAGDTYSGIEGLVGSGFGDTLQGDAGGNNIYGGSGADLIFGREGDDYLSGDAGDDSLFGGLGADVMSGGAGYDYLRYDGASAGIVVRLDFHAGYSGEAAGDLIGDDVEGIIGSNFADTLIGDGQANIIVGNAGNDTILGGAGADTLVGGAGADALLGDAGPDVLAGGADADAFYVAAVDNVVGQFDLVTDFQDGLDRIYLQGWNPATLAATEANGNTYITTLDSNYSTGVIIANATLAQVLDQVVLI